tara:strand:- start:264 stop:449 length:186 start_codon:yes stop_codon:yes gene_type:complete
MCHSLVVTIGFTLVNFYRLFLTIEFLLALVLALFQTVCDLSIFNQCILLGISTDGESTLDF